MWSCSTSTRVAPVCHHARLHCIRLCCCCARSNSKSTMPAPGTSGSHPVTRLPGRTRPRTDYPMRRGEIRLVDLDPVRGSGSNKRRPAVIVSNDSANAAAARLGRGVVTVVPVTSNITRVLPFQVLLPAEAVGLKVDSKAQAEQVRSVAVERLGPVVGRLPAPVMAQLESALRLHLQL